MYKEHLRELIQVVLKEYDLYSRDAEELLMLTAATESKMGYYLRQLGNGPALGIFQCEPATLWWMQREVSENNIKYTKKLDILCRKLGYEKGLANYLSDPFDVHDILGSKEQEQWNKWLKISSITARMCLSDNFDINFVLNLKLQILSARLVYWFKTSKAIPSHKDIQGLAEYWKTYYNSSLGAGTVEGAIVNYKKYVL